MLGPLFPNERVVHQGLRFVCKNRGGSAILFLMFIAFYLSRGSVREESMWSAFLRQIPYYCLGREVSNNIFEYNT